MALLQIKNLQKCFGNNQVLKGVSFSLEKGQVLAIIGSSGSGKTTLLRCLNFLETPDHGEIIVDGKPLFAAGTKYTAQRAKRCKPLTVCTTSSCFLVQSSSTNRPQIWAARNTI